MSSGDKTGKKRSKAFYRKSAFGAKRHCSGANILEPGIRGFLVMCNSNESSAVRESYNILNEYADLLYGQEQAKPKSELATTAEGSVSDDEDEDCDDVEKALRKEVDGLKNTAAAQRRFQNVATKAKNCVFIRTTVEDPVRVVVKIMEDIAERGLKKARYAARILPIVGTCKAHTSDIAKLASEVLKPVFSSDNSMVPSSYTVLFKARNNNGNTCGKTSVIPTVTNAVSEINSAVKFSWSDFEVAILIEIVCTVCCVGVAPNYTRLRKYNLQELQQGPRLVVDTGKTEDTVGKCIINFSELENTASKLNQTKQGFDKLQRPENDSDVLLERGSVNQDKEERRPTIPEKEEENSMESKIEKSDVCVKETTATSESDVQVAESVNTEIYLGTEPNVQAREIQGK